MNSESLIKALTNLPSDVFDFDEVNFNDNSDEFESVDSLGSCCNSPNQSSDGSLSSCEDADSEFFIFSNKSNPGSQKPDHDLTGSKTESETKIKRKLECKVKRNERERRRVRRLADGFRKLREVVPGNYKKLSKLDTLKQALDYMANLSDILDAQNSMRFDQPFPAPFIKVEQYDYPTYDLPAYQNTISYQPLPDWMMYQQQQQLQNKIIQVPQLSHPSNLNPYYEQQRPMMMPYH